MSPRARKATIIVLAALAVALILAPAALAAAGGGSAGFSGGGGGGGGGGGHGSGFALYIIVDLLIHIAVLGHGLGALVLVTLALLYWFLTKGMPKVQAWWAERMATRGPGDHKASKRERRVELAAAEAAEDDPEYAPDAVRESAAILFKAVQRAWDQQDTQRLREMVGRDLFKEWSRRLQDFERRGWRNRVQLIGEPAVEYVGLKHTGDAHTDHVVVRIDARLKDFVVDRFGRHLKRTGRLGETTRIREFWTLQRDDDRWYVASIEQDREGQHQLEDAIVASAWSDETRMRDEALVEGAVADAVPEGVKIAEVADLSYEGDAHAAAMDLSLADGRFAPDVLEVTARRAIDAWAQAVDGDDTRLQALATSRAADELLYAGDSTRHTRVVVRGPQVARIRIVGLDAAAEPATMMVEVDLTGRRYIENRDTTAVVAGSRSKATSFTERWTFSLTDDEAQPWRITAVGAPVGLV
jgi:predicted lipid-binding transport protein (Tim44 family)